MFFDAHCHLNEFEEPEREILNAKRANVQGIVSNSVDLESMEKNTLVASSHDMVKCAFGVHPSNLLSMSKESISSAFGFLEENLERAVAVGEIGLDFKHATTPGEKKKQADYFRAQLEIAERFSKPVIVHSRLAVSRAIKILSEYKCRVLFHWFSGTMKELKEAIELGGFFSIGPAIEFNQRIRLIAAAIPGNRLLTETDAPVPFNGKPSTPSWIPRVTELIAMARGEETHRVEKAVEKNFKEFFRVQKSRQ